MTGIDGDAADDDRGTAPSGPAARRVVLHPRTEAARRQDRARAFGSHVRGYTVDADEVATLMRRQRQGALRCFLVIFLPVLVLPLVFAAFPDLAATRLGPLPPTAWLLLGPIILGSIIAVAGINDRIASRREDRWLAERSGRPR